MKTKKYYKLVIPFIMVIFLNGCSRLEVLSKWQENNLVIDGSKQDWESKLKYLKDEKIAIGITNDVENLYLCLVVSDNKRIMNIVRSGLTIWIKPQNDRETFGIEYPIKNNLPVIKDFSKSSQKTDPREKQKQFISKQLIDQNEFLVLNEDKFPLYASPLISKNGIEIRMDLEFNQLIYELKIPLVTDKDGLLKINMALNDEIKLGFISGKMERAERPGRSQMSNHGGGGRRSGGKRGGMSGGQMQQRSNSTIQPIDLWITTVMASN